MIRSYLAVISTFIFSFGFSQKPIQEKTISFTITGEIRNFTGNTIYLHHKWNEKDFTDSANVVKGKFKFSLKTVDPNMYWFTTVNNINAQPNFIFFADGTPVKARLIGDSIAYSTIEAGQTHKDYLEYRGIINNFVMIQQKMQEDFNVAGQKGDADMQNAIRNEYMNLNGKYLSTLKEFIKTHPKSAVSGYIIYNDLNSQGIPLQDVIEALSYVDKSIEHTKFIKLAKKRVNDIKGTTVGYAASDFSQNNPEGKKVSLSDFRGKYVLIDFWASWCRPCRMENPNVVAAYNQYKDKGFTVLGVSLDNSKDPWLAAIAQDNLTWTHVSDLKGWNNEVSKLYGVTGIPQNFLIDKDGKILAKDLRGAQLDEKLAEIIK